MAEILSISASIAGLVSLADTTFKHVYKYTRAVKDARTDVQSLSEEVNDLGSVLRTLEALTSDLEAEGDKFDPTLRNHHLDHCRHTLIRIETRAKKAVDRFAKSKRESIVQQLKWPFSASETKGLLADLSRHKATINTALAADTMRKLQLSLTKANELGAQVTAIGEAVRRIEINTLIEVNSYKQSILSYFMKTSPQRNLETSIRLRHPTTGLWLTESPSFRHWLETPGSKLWLTGIPGAGKTILAGSAIQEALTRAHAASKISVAFFFCDYKDPTTWSTVNILGAICSQLARQRDEAFDILGHYYNDLHPTNRLAKTPDPDELRAIISQMSEAFDQTIIIVDGLDECGDSTDDVVDTLMHVADYSEKVSMALFSRDHFDIRIRLDRDFEVIPIAAYSEDIRTYVRAEIDKRIRNWQLRLNDVMMKEEIMETLVNRAEGMFRWVVCQLDYLCDCAHDGERREALRKLPPDLPESYRRLLERVNRCTHAVQVAVNMCLQFIALAGSRLTILALRQAISTPEVLGAGLDSRNMISEQEIRRRCSSLIRISADGQHLEFAHFSVQEFLEDESALSRTAGHDGLEKYFISEFGSRSLLAAQCLRFLQLKNFEEKPRDKPGAGTLVRERNEKYPFYKYAAIKWMHLTKDGLNDSEVLNAARALFHPSKTPQFQNWAIHVLHFILQYNRSHDEAKPYRRALATILDASFKPLHMAAALNLPGICNFLLGQGIPVNLQFYTATPIDLAVASIWSMGWIRDGGQTLHDDSMWGRKRASYHLPASRRGAQFYSNLWPLRERLLLPVNKQRNLTVDCLIDMGARPYNDLLSAGGLSVFSTACLVGAWLCDFYPAIKLLSCNIAFGQAELHCFEYSLEMLWEKNDGNAESSTRAFFHHLNAARSYTSEWGRLLSSTVWQWAVEKNLTYTNDPFLVGSSISMSKEALRAMARTAISNNDTERLERCLADERFDKTASDPENGDTYLHLAARVGALEAFEKLLAAGCNPGLENNEDDLPIYLCSWTQVYDFLHMLRKFGVSISCSNTQGYTICHIWARDCIEFCDFEFLSRVFDLDPEGTADALQMKTIGGDTPFLLILKRADAGSVAKRKALCLLEICSKIPGFWRNHEPILGAAVNFGSREVVHYLQRAGVGFEVPLPGTKTPLHLLPATTSLGNLRVLLTFYENSVEQRVEGKLPVEAYILTSLRHRIPPHDNIVEALVPPSLTSKQKGVGATIWGFICTLLSEFQEHDDGTSFPPLEPKEWRHSTAGIFRTLLRLGALQDYEEKTKECGLIPLFSGILDMRPNGWTLCISTDIIRDILLQTNHWATAKQSRVVLELLKSATIRDVNLDLAWLLLRNGVDVHSRSDGQSTIELACDGSVAAGVCASADGRAILQLILDYSNSRILNGISSLDGRRKGLLHSLATSENGSSILWLMEALVERGVDVNSLTRCSYQVSALSYHLYESSSECSQLLLDLGADPLAGGHFGSPSAIQASIETGNVAFLRLLADRAIKTSSSMGWEKLTSLRVKIGDRTLVLESTNALHWASLNSKADCLQFLLDESLAPIEASKSAEGWTPLHVSARKGSVETARLLVSRGFNIMEKTNLGETPMHLAVRGNHFALVKLFIESGAIQSLDAGRRTPMYYARERRFFDIVQYLGEVSRQEAPTPVTS